VSDSQVESEKRINLLYDDVKHHFHVIKNFKGALSRHYVCKGCNKGCNGVTHRCQKTCSDCMSIPPCPYADVRIPCESCNRQFRSRTCFVKHKKNKLGKKTYVKRRGTAPHVIHSYLIKGTNISNHSVLSVTRTKRLVISVLCSR